MGMVTAWGTEAVADTIPVRLSMTPEITLLNAHVLYGNNYSSGDLRSLGTIPEGLTSSFDHTVDDTFVATPPTFAVVGLYDTGDVVGIAVSLRNNELIDNASWISVFGNNPFTEAEVIAELQAGRAGSFLRQYGHPTYLSGWTSAIDFGGTGTLANFSEATFGGTVSVNVVPEPASFALVVSAMGIVWLPLLRRSRGQ